MVTLSLPGIYWRKTKKQSYLGRSHQGFAVFVNYLVFTKMSSNRGLRLLKAIQSYVKTKPNKFDTSMLFSKVIFRCTIFDYGKIKNLIVLSRILLFQIQFQSACEGKVIGVFIVEENMCNIMDTLHGGYICSIMDALTTYAQMCHENGRLSWTTEVRAK